MKRLLGVMSAPGKENPASALPGSYAPGAWGVKKPPAGSAGGRGLRHDSRPALG